MKRITIPTGKRLVIDPITRILFFEDFESPVISGPNYFVSSPTLTNWVRANQGYGSGSHGIDNVNSGNWVGSGQGYNFNYTNSGLTTAQGVIGSLKLDYKYTVEFDLQYDLGIEGLNGATSGTGNAKVGDKLTVELCAWDNAQNRNDTRNTVTYSMVSTAKTVPNDGTWHSYSMEYATSLAIDAAKEGLDLTIRLRGQTAGAVVDNIKVTEVYNG